jgi:hypothetical protein
VIGANEIVGGPGRARFFSPWENPGRIIALLPLVFWVWRTRNIRFSIFTHILLNTGGAVMMLIAIFSAPAA